VRWESVEAEDSLVPESDTTDATGRIRATFTTSKPGRRTVKGVVAGTKLEASLVLTAGNPPERTGPVDAGQAPAPDASPSLQPAATEQDAGTAVEPRAPDPVEEAPAQDGAVEGEAP
jgi:hypothetical protein